MAHPSKRKGDRIERQIIAAHITEGVHAERVDARLGQFAASKSHDIDVYPRGKECPPICAEVKARKDGSGFAQRWNGWLGENDALFLRRDRCGALSSSCRGIPGSDLMRGQE
jgi:hypothetical protein